MQIYQNYAFIYKCSLLENFNKIASALNINTIIHKQLFQSGLLSKLSCK